MAPSPPAFVEHTSDLIDRAIAQAEQDAHAAIGLLRAFRTLLNWGPDASFPAQFLLDLAAAGRLLHWEHQGLSLHLEAGLPTAGAAIARAFRNAARRAAEPTAPDEAPPLGQAIFDLAAQRLAWAGPARMRAEVVLDTPDEDALIDALAPLLLDLGLHLEGTDRGAES